MSGAFKRFAVAATSLTVPLLVVCFVVRALVSGLPFLLGINLGIVGLILAGMSAIYAMAIRGSRDFRAGAVAVAMTLSWVIAFVYPLVRR